MALGGSFENFVGINYCSESAAATDSIDCLGQREGGSRSTFPTIFRRSWRIASRDSTMRLSCHRQVTGCSSLVADENDGGHSMKNFDSFLGGAKLKHKTDSEQTCAFYSISSGGQKLRHCFSLKLRTSTNKNVVVAVVLRLFFVAQVSALTAPSAEGIDFRSLAVAYAAALAVTWIRRDTHLGALRFRAEKGGLYTNQKQRHCHTCQYVALVG